MRRSSRIGAPAVNAAPVANMQNLLTALTAQNQALQAEAKRNSQSLARLQVRELPVWDGVSDVRDFIQEWVDEITLANFAAAEWPGHFKRSLPTHFRTTWKHIVDSATLANGGNCPLFSQLKNHFLATVLDVSESTTVLGALESDNFKMRYKETLIAFYARFRHAIHRCNEAIAMSDSLKPANSAMRSGPLSLPKIIELFGKALVPDLRRAFIKHKDTVTSLSEMYTHVRKAWDQLLVQRQYYSDTSPDFDPHHAPLIASSITGRPTAQVERKFQEHTRLWNPSNQTMPLGIYGMPPPSSQSTADFSKELKDVQRSVSTSLADAIAEMRSLLEAKSAPTKTLGNDVAGDDTALLSVLKHSSSSSFHGHHLGDAPISDDSGYDPCSLPISWGCDPLHVALARADGEPLSKYCVWCETSAHNCRECPAHCFRCGRKHALPACTLSFREAKCSQGHNGHLDHSCLTRILGLIDPDRASRGSRPSRGSQQRRDDAPPGRCYRCGDMGHWSSSCPKNGSTRQGFSSSAKTCFLCNQPGHSSDQCTSQKPKVHSLKSETIVPSPAPDLQQQMCQAQAEQTAVLNKLVQQLSAPTPSVKPEEIEDAVPTPALKRLMETQDMYDALAKKVKLVVDQLPSVADASSRAVGSMGAPAPFQHPGYGPPPLQPHGYHSFPNGPPYAHQVWAPQIQVHPSNTNARRGRNSGHGGHGGSGGSGSSGGHGHSHGGHGHGAGRGSGRGGHAAGSR